MVQPTRGHKLLQDGKSPSTRKKLKTSIYLPAQWPAVKQKQQLPQETINLCKVQKKWHYLVQVAIARNTVDLDGIKVNRNNNFPVQKMVWLHSICILGQ